jgi:hypothetical protein
METDITGLLKSIEGKKREPDTFRPFSPEIVRKVFEIPFENKMSSGHYKP